MDREYLSMQDNSHTSQMKFWLSRAKIKSTSGILRFRISFDGLGDNLEMTPIPRIAKEYGYTRVLLDECAGYRDPAIRDIVWSANPYLDGIYDSRKCGIAARRISMPWECIDGWDYVDGQKQPKRCPGTRIQYYLAGYGLYASRHCKPEIYYKPVINTSFAQKTVIDLNSYSSNYEPYKERIENVIRHMLTGNCIQIVCNARAADGAWRGSKYRNIVLNGVPIIECDSLKELITIYSSCKRLICALSGTALLANALNNRKPDIVFMQKFYALEWAYLPNMRFLNG